MRLHEQLLSPSQAAARLGVCSQTVRNFTKSGKLACVETPLGRLIPREAVEALLRERECERERELMSV